MPRHLSVLSADCEISLLHARARVSSGHHLEKLLSQRLCLEVHRAAGPHCRQLCCWARPGTPCSLPCTRSPTSPASWVSSGVFVSLLCVHPLSASHVLPRPGSATNSSSLLRVPVVPGAVPLCRRRLQRVFTRPC